MIFERINFADTPDGRLNPWVIVCGATGCFWTVCANTFHAAEILEAYHICKPPLGKGGTVTNIMYEPRNQGKSAMMVMWDELDNCVEQIKSGAADTEYYKTRAGGIAFALSTLAGPHYGTSEAVSREALERWKMRHGEIPERPTAGYGGYNPPPPGSRTLTEAVREGREIAAKKPILHDLTPEAVAGIRNASKAMGFTPDQLAKAYSITIGLVRQLLEEEPVEL